jgi:hypothetical protein
MMRDDIGFGCHWLIGIGICISTGWKFKFAFSSLWGQIHRRTGANVFIINIRGNRGNSDQRKMVGRFKEKHTQNWHNNVSKKNNINGVAGNWLQSPIEGGRMFGPRPTSLILLVFGLLVYVWETTRGLLP